MSSPFKLTFWLGLLLLLGTSLENANSFSRGRDSPFPASSSDLAEKESSSSSEETEVIQSSSGNKLNKTHSSQLINSVHEDLQLKEILCPGTSILYRYDLRAGKCGQTETQSHCGANMVFTAEPDSSSYGYCECDFESHSVPLVYHLPTNQCYPVYEQAYCRPGEWLVISSQAKGPICTRNHCLPPRKSQSPSSSGRRSKLLFPGSWNTPEIASADSLRDHPIKLRSFSVKAAADNSQLKSSSSPLVPLNGTGPCVSLGQPSKYCSPDESVLIPSGKFAPTCLSPGFQERGLTLIPNPCPPGSYYSIIGYCQPVWDF